MRKMLLILSLMPLATTLACQSSSPPKPAQNGGPATDGGQQTYTGWVGSYLTSTCAMSGCHSAGGTSPDLSSYTAARAAGASIVSSMKTGGMPKGSAADPAAIAKLQAWIDGGMLQSPTAGTGTGINTGGGYQPVGTGTGTGYQPIGGSTTADPNAIAYNGWVGTYLTSTCATSGCHSAGGQPPDLSTYAAAQSAASSIVSAMQTSMPPSTGHADPAAIQKMQQWVQASMPQSAPSTGGYSPISGGTNTGAGGYVPSTGTTGTQIPVVTYAGAIQGLMNQYCTSCHRPGGSAQPDLSTQQLAQFNADKILADVMAGRMPQGQQMGQQNIQQFYNWVNTGAQ